MNKVGDTKCQRSTFQTRVGWNVEMLVERRDAAIAEADDLRNQLVIAEVKIAELIKKVDFWSFECAGMMQTMAEHANSLSNYAQNIGASLKAKS